MDIGLLRFKRWLTWSRPCGPDRGSESALLQPRKPAYADMERLRATISQSPIRIAVAPATLAVRLADWEHTRLAPDVDTVILEWIVSHAPATARAARHFDA